MASKENAVADALIRAHEALLDDLRKLKEAAGPASADGLLELRTRLDATRAHVTQHFRSEEENGYLAAVRKREPRLERAIQQLADEHRQLSQSLDELIIRVGAAGRLSETLREEVRDWAERVRRHELRENDLVQDAFNMDIGAED